MTNEKPNLMPLAGLRVLDIATMLAGPFCATTLGEFGAEVIKVEMPGQGEGVRYSGTMTAAGSSLMWLSESRNKKSITLDFRTKAGVELFKRLVKTADVVVENFRPGTIEKWGIGYDVLKSVKPDIILARVSAYGQTGPYRQRPGFARVAHAFAGLSNLAGEPKRAPVIPGSTSLADYITGVYAALGVLLAVIARKRDGMGQVVDVALYEGILRMLDDMIPNYAKTGYIRERMGADTVNHVPHSHYRTRDGRWIALACSNDRMWERFVTAMKRPDIAQSGRFDTMVQRIALRDEVNVIVAEFVASMDRDDFLKLCIDQDVPAGPLNNVADIFEDPQIQSRGNLVSMDIPGEGSVVVPNIVPRLSETPGKIRTLGPSLGEHNLEIYGGELNLTESELADLRDQRVI
jgi:crotonobetainyl-CoA:carnitine CoA-transferase CaiB-like acyl-CoA transferase